MKKPILAAITAAIVLVGPSINAVAASSETGCVYEGKHSRFCLKRNGVTWSPAPGAFKIKDTSFKRPLGGPKSLPNEVHRKVIEKPRKWLKKRLGF